MNRFTGRISAEDKRLIARTNGIARKVDSVYDPLPPPLFYMLAPSSTRWIADRHGRLVAIGAHWTQLTGHPESDAMVFGWGAFVEPKDRESLSAAAQLSSRPMPVRMRVRRPDHSWHWTLTRMRLLLDSSGEPRWYGVTEEIQDRTAEESVVLEKTLLEIEEHYRWSVEVSPQAPWTATPAGAIQEIGPLWLRLTGMLPEKSLGAGWLTALHPGDRQPTLSSWESGLRSGAPIDVDFRIRLANGDYRWMRARAAPRTDEYGRIVRWYGTLEDIHERKMTQQALLESEERFRLAVQSACLGIWDYDAISGIRTWSAELRAMLGLTAAREPTVDLALQLVHPEDRAQLRSILDAVAEQKTPQHVEATLRIHRADTGELRWLKSVGWNSLCQAGRLVQHPSNGFNNCLAANKAAGA